MQTFVGCISIHPLRSKLVRTIFSCKSSVIYLYQLCTFILQLLQSFCQTRWRPILAKGHFQILRSGLLLDHSSPYRFLVLNHSSVALAGRSASLSCCKVNSEPNIISLEFPSKQFPLNPDQFPR